ncbi:MAG TPA: DUF1684 domain-containing protein [Vicinamibacterales bacterium]
MRANGAPGFVASACPPPPRLRRDRAVARSAKAGRRKWLALALAVLLPACSSGPSAPDDAGYVSEITAARLEKDRTFREQTDPVPPDKKDVLLPLPYFAVDPGYSVPAALRLADERPVFEMPTSTGTLRRYQLVGAIEFVFQGQPMSLGAFVEDGQDIRSLFVPFADTTTGTETYSAGRYLDLHPTASGLYTLDFNKAYNPYCAYNSRYECPFPPPSNRLKVPIRAGEKAPGA